MLGMQTHPLLRQLPPVLQKGTHIPTKIIKAKAYVCQESYLS